MHELPSKPPRPTPAAPTAQHIGTELHQPPIGLPRRQPRARAAQIPQQQVDPILGVDPDD